MALRGGYRGTVKDRGRQGAAVVWVVLMLLVRLAGAQEVGYRLQAGDAFEVQYRYTPEYNQTVSVQPDGKVSLALLGDVACEG